MKRSWLEQFADRHFWSLIVGIFIVFCFFSYGIGHVGASKGRVYTIDSGFYDAEQMKQPKNINGQNIWNNGTYSNTRVNKNHVDFDIRDKISVGADLTINPTSGTWLWYPANISGNVISYTNTRGTVKYTDYDTILKEEIVLFEPVDSISWKINLSVKPQSLGFSMDADGYSIRDPANENERIKIPFPFVVDSLGTRRDLRFNWNNGQKLLSLPIDDSGLVYPLTVDPVWIVDSGGAVGGNPAIAVNGSNIINVGYFDFTNAKIKLWVNDSGSFTCSTVMGMGYTTYADLSMVIDEVNTDLPVFFTPGLGYYDRNITWWSGGHWRACQTHSDPASAVKHQHTPLMVTSTGKVRIFYKNTTNGPFNVTEIDDISGTGPLNIVKTIYQIGFGTWYWGSGARNTSDYLISLWHSSTGSNWTSISEDTPSIITTKVMGVGLINTSQRGTSLINDPITNYPKLASIPPTASDGTTTGRSINLTTLNLTTQKFYYTEVFLNGSSGMSSIQTVNLAINSTGYGKILFIERTGPTTLEPGFLVFITRETSPGAWSIPEQIGANAGTNFAEGTFDQNDNYHAVWEDSISNDLIYYFEPLPVGAGGAPPVASFTKNDTVLHLNEAINLSDTSSCYDCTNRQWNLTLETPADSYHKNQTSLDWTISAWPRWGYYSIVKYLQNASGSDTETDHFTVINITPAAVFTCLPLSGTRPLAVTCTDGSAGNYTHRNWTPGWGANISTETNPVFTYGDAGTFSVNLTIWGDDLEYSIELKNNYITVSDPVPPVPGAGNCTATILTNTSSGYPPLWVNLSYIGNNTVIDNITWMLGEGNTSTDWSPTAVYNWSATFTVSAYACNTTYNECCTVTAKIMAWFFTCLQTGEDGNIPVALMYLLVPLTMGLSLFAVGSYDNRVYANIILGGFGSSIMWFYLASNIITANVFYLASDPGCVMMDTPLFWLFVLFGVIMTVYSVALVAEAVMERNVQDLGGEEE